MAGIELEQLAHSYLPHPRGVEDYALRHMDLTWEDGGAYALLGPSGCGKTTMLNVISGLLVPSQGRVRFDGEDVTALPPEARNIAQVFQFPVVYDTMSVFDNLAFPLRNRGHDHATVRRRVGEVAEMLDLSAVLERKAANLGAETKQMISMGRGLVRSDVAAVLFDEPLTVIDPHLKWELRRKLKEVHQQLGLTLVYVTHDQLEALTFADRVAVMVDGRVVQMGTPQALFEHPEHTFVGYFIGSPGMNLLECRVTDGAAEVAGARIPLSRDTAAAAAGTEGRLELGIRPEFLQLSIDGDGVPVQVEAVEDFGTYRLVSVQLAGKRLYAQLDEDAPVPDGTARVAFPTRWTRLYADGRLIG